MLGNGHMPECLPCTCSTASASDGFEMLRDHNRKDIPVFTYLPELYDDGTTSSQILFD